jgi:hypothetical protein
VHAAPAQLIEADFLAPSASLEGPFDAVCLLGNTIMTIADIDDALALFQRMRVLIGADGCIILDDCPHDFWPELTEGNWQSGISEDRSMQMVWSRGDAVFVLRSGDAIDPECWSPRRTDRQFRLWSMGALRLVAAATGLSGPEREVESGLLVLRREPA